LSEYKITSILITALGGEGGGTLMNWILDCARNCNLYVQGTSVPGVAQRTGSTSYYIEICDRNYNKGKEPVLSLYPKPGRVDVVIASEFLEAARIIERGYVNPERTTLITSSSRTYTNTEKIHIADGRFNFEKIMNTCSKMSKKFIHLDLNQIAADNSTIVSATMFGSLSGTNIFPWDKDVCESIFKNDDFGKNSLAGFRYAYKITRTYNNTGVKVKKSIDKEKQDNKYKITDNFLNSIPNNLRKIILLGQKRCEEYQNISYADLYIKRLKKILTFSNIENDRTCNVLENVAKRLALWMTYEDIPRVAQLKIKPDRFNKIKKEVKLEKEQLIIVQDIFKPGKDEIVAMLPRRIGQWLSRRNKIFFFMPFVGKGMKINSLSVTGFLILKFLSSFRFIRKSSYRYQEEQKGIEEWLYLVSKSIKVSVGFTEGLADMPQILKGYGETWERGKLKYDKINKALIKNRSYEKILENDVTVLKKAISISLNDLEIKELEALLNNYQR
tara:strand:- start:7674 stop:9176 length:1503 start_codon:yes stop_codon:yes gene_type:complete